jgi:hypothetical protein
MSQLKQDEWPADGEPTTVESQTPPTPPESLRAHEPRPHRQERDSESELSTVTPGNAVDEL